MKVAPAIARTELFSYLVTRHTGRAVRTSIEQQIAGHRGAVLAVLDLRHVPLIDFSCADEVIAKLVAAPPASLVVRRFFLFRGIAEHHQEPIECALARQGLAAAAESIDGSPFIIGEIDRACARAWRELWEMGAADAGILAGRLGATSEAADGWLRQLDRRGLVIAGETGYVSFRRALEEAADGVADG